jgi:hypothetical protein
MNNIRDVAREPWFAWCVRGVIGHFVNDRGNKRMASAASMILAMGAAGRFARACSDELAAANAGKEG